MPSARIGYGCCVAWMLLTVAAFAPQGASVHAQSADKQGAAKQVAPKQAAPRQPAHPSNAPRSAAGPTPANIDRNGVLILVRSALLALDQANKTGNYTVLRDLGAPGFQVNTAARLAEIFAAQRSQNLDLSGVAVLEPQLTTLPQIEPSGMLHMAGFFPSTPLQVNFELMFAAADRQWKIFGISVNLVNSAPQAPPTPPPAASAAPSNEPPPQPPTGAVKGDKGATK